MQGSARYNRSMPRRVLAFLLALTLFWSGVSTLEVPVLAPVLGGQTHSLGLADGKTGAPQGSVAHHHLDDLPHQALNEPSADAPSLLPATAGPIARAVAMEHPHASLASAAALPFLAQALRPPSGFGLTG